MESWNYKRLASGPLVWQVPESRRTQMKSERWYGADHLLHMQRFSAVVKVTVDGQPQRAVECRLELSEYDRNRQRWPKDRFGGSSQHRRNPEAGEAAEEEGAGSGVRAGSEGGGATVPLPVNPITKSRTGEALQQRVQDMLRELLGREPTESEMADWGLSLETLSEILGRRRAKTQPPAAPVIGAGRAVEQDGGPPAAGSPPQPGFFPNLEKPGGVQR